MDTKAKDQFWDVVLECLLDIHGLTRAKAARGIEELRKRVDSQPKGTARNIFYHTEPFEVACDLAGKELDITTFQPQYNRIVSRHMR